MKDGRFTSIRDRESTNLSFLSSGMYEVFMNKWERGFTKGVLSQKKRLSYSQSQTLDRVVEKVIRLKKGESWRDHIRDFSMYDKQ